MFPGLTELLLTTTQTQTSQPASSAQCVPMECADVPDVCNAEQSNDPQPSQQHDEPDDWDPDAKLKLKVGDVTVVRQTTAVGSLGRECPVRAAQQKCLMYQLAGH